LDAAQMNALANLVAAIVIKKLDKKVLEWMFQNRDPYQVSS
jgi:hypothetical protein